MSIGQKKMDVYETGPVSTVSSRAIIGRADPPWKFSLSLIFFISGFCGLIYQIIWIRQFGLVFGSTVFAMSVVIAVFFGGLAIGSRLFGRISISYENPVRMYAFLEMFISLYALAFPRILHAGEALYGLIHPSISENFALLVVVRALISTFILLLPTVMMGGTLPLLSRHFIGDLKAAGCRAGWIYGFNTLGASMGSLLAGFLLLKNMGVSNTNLFAGVINLMLGLVALGISRRTRLTARPHPEWASGPSGGKREWLDRSGGAISLTVVCFGLSGFVSMSYEVIWLRYTLFFFRDTSYLYTGVITVFIIGIGLGSMLVGWLVDRIRLRIAMFGILELGIGLSMILAIYLPIPYYSMISGAGEEAGRNILAFLFIMLIIPTAFMGGTFPLVTKIITTDLQFVGSQVGKAYALNTTGSILGSLAAGFFFFPVLGLQVTLYALFGLNMILASILMVHEGHFACKFLGIFPLLLCLLFPISMQCVTARRLPELVVHKISPKDEIIEVAEGTTGTTWAVRSRYFGVSLLENRVVISRGGPGSFLTQGYIPLLLSPKIPQRFLGLCFGGGLSYYGARLYPEIEHFDFVDISKINIEIAIRHMPENKFLIDDERVNFVIDDAYSFLKYTEKTFDLILMEPTPPMLSFRNAALYAGDFYQLARKRLSAEGIFSQVLPLRHLSAKETVSVMKTFSTVFEYPLLWWNGLDPVMIGSNRPYAFDIREINRRLNRPPIHDSLKEISKGVGYQRIGHFLSGLMLGPESFKKVCAEGEVYTNDLNSLEFSSGSHIDFENIKTIHRHLTPWRKAQKLFIEVKSFEKYFKNLEVRREYLMKMMYQLSRRTG